MELTYTEDSLREMFERMFTDADLAERTHRQDYHSMLKELEEAVASEGQKKSIPQAALQPFLEGYAELYKTGLDDRQAFMEVYGYGKKTIVVDPGDGGGLVFLTMLAGAGTLGAGFLLAPVVGPIAAGAAALCCYLGGIGAIDKIAESSLRKKIDEQDPDQMNIRGYAEHIEFFNEREELAERTIEALLSGGYLSEAKDEAAEEMAEEPVQEPVLLLPPPRTEKEAAAEEPAAEEDAGEEQ